MSYSFKFGIAVIWLFSAAIVTEALWVNKVKSTTSVDKQLFMDILQPLTQRTGESCKEQQQEFNMEEALTITGCRVDMELIPKIRLMSRESILRLNSTLHLFPQMDMFQRLTFLKDELEPICNVIPTLFKCFETGFRGGYKCLGMGSIIFEFAEMYLQSLCPNQKAISTLLGSKYSACFQTYTEIIQNCLKFESRSCRMTECVRRTFQPCGIDGLKQKLVNLFERLEFDSGCKLVEYSFKKSMTRMESMRKQTAVAVNTPQGSVIYYASPKTEQLKATNKPCVHEELKDFVFSNENREIPDFFLDLDNYCEAWCTDTNDCRQSGKRIEWSRFMTSLCAKAKYINSNDLVATVEKCKSFSIPVRILQLEEYCRSESRSEQLPLLGAFHCGHLIKILISEFYKDQPATSVMCEAKMTLKALADTAIKNCSRIHAQLVWRPGHHKQAHGGGVLVFVPVI